MLHTLLINMPFVSLARPALGLSLLKARLLEESYPCEVRYGSLLFAEHVGFEAYELVIEGISPAMFFGDWIFSQWLFPARDHSAYVATLQNQLKDHPGTFERAIALRAKVEEFLENCLQKFNVSAFEVIGFTTTFEQNMASLALARLIKVRYPQKIIVFGGANCEGVMGLELHRSFPWIDYICSGESDNSFPLLVRRLNCGEPTDCTPGLVYRREGKSTIAAPPDRIHDMDALPDPDFDDYFIALNISSLRERVNPTLLIESARGCWWGAKSHCTFCGLNGATMVFRAKSAGRVYAELKRQKERYGIGRFTAVDNIMSYEYFRDLLPMLKQANPGVSLFYEIKSNLKRTHVELLRDAGVWAVQPGIESLNTHVLRLMHKGVTAIQNVQLLRLCEEYGIEIAWNLLYGFPGETAEDYVETESVIQAIAHLKPPGVVAPVRLDRFSPNYDSSTYFGLIEIQPFSMYASIYPFALEVVSNLAYFFEYRYADGRDCKTYIGPVLGAVERWQQHRGGTLRKHYGVGPELMLEDSRTEPEPICYGFNGLQREIYDLCDEIQSGETVKKFAADRGAAADLIDPFLRELVDQRLMLREGNQYLSLAIDARRRDRSFATPATTNF